GRTAGDNSVSQFHLRLRVAPERPISAAGAACGDFIVRKRKWPPPSAGAVCSAWLIVNIPFSRSFPVRGPHIPQPTLVERAASFEPVGPIVREQPARGGRREYTAGGRYRSARDRLAEVHEPPLSVERE